MLKLQLTFVNGIRSSIKLTSSNPGGNRHFWRLKTSKFEGGVIFVTPVQTSKFLYRKTRLDRLYPVIGQHMQIQLMSPHWHDETINLRFQPTAVCRSFSFCFHTMFCIIPAAEGEDLGLRVPNTLLLT